MGTTDLPTTFGRMMFSVTLQSAIHYEGEISKDGKEGARHFGDPQ